MTSNPKSGKNAFQSDSDIHITYEDQQKINKFARQNAKLSDLREELKSKERELQNLEDASDELLMVEDESLPVPYMIGDVFMLQNLEETQKMIDAAKEKYKLQKNELTAKCEAITQIMQELKVALYAKFGNNINLESEE